MACTRDRNVRRYLQLICNMSMCSQYVLQLVVKRRNHHSCVPSCLWPSQIRRCCYTFHQHYCFSANSVHLYLSVSSCIYSHIGCSDVIDMCSLCSFCVSLVLSIAFVFMFRSLQRWQRPERLNSKETNCCIQRLYCTV